MCDERTFTRRGFTVLSAAALAACVASPRNALPTVGNDLKVRTPDGEAEAHFVHPATGKYPAVIMWADINGLRNVFRQMARRLAESGYAVLVTNPYYRSVQMEMAPDGVTFADPVITPEIMARVHDVTPDNIKVDAPAFMKFLDAQDAVNTARKAGSVGYCIGGPFAMRTAAIVPSRVSSVASFHGYEMVTDGPDSPHLVIPGLTHASLLIGIAEADDRAEPNTRKVLRKTCDAAKVSCDIEVFHGARHGWCTPDSAAYDRVRAEKAWDRLLDYFGKTLAKA